MKMYIFLVTLGFCALFPASVSTVYAQSHDGHVHDDSNEKHVVVDSPEHEAHEDQGSHASHGDDEEGGHDEHGDEHNDGKTEIAPDMAESAGIVIEQAAEVMIGRTATLTGRIIINQNAIANVRARFPGIVRSVKVNLGEAVEKGQVLAIIEANESLRDYSVTAPINGVILERHTNLGDVANGKPLFVIVDLSEVWAKFHVFPKDADRVKSGQSVRVHTLEEGREGVARIDMLLPTADAASQTLIAITPLSNQSGLWRPGMTVEGDVMVTEKRATLAVRMSAIQTMENRTVVFVKSGNSYEAIPVQTGISDGDYVEVTSGLQEGQEYVSEGSFVIKADILKSGAEHHH